MFLSSGDHEGHKDPKRVPRQRLKGSPSQQASIGQSTQNQLSESATGWQRKHVPQIEQNHSLPKATYHSMPFDHAASLSDHSRDHNASQTDSLRGIGDWVSTAAEPYLERPISLFCPYHTALFQEVVETHKGLQGLDPFERFLIEDPFTLLRHLDANYLSSFMNCTHCADVRRNVSL